MGSPSVRRGGPRFGACGVSVLAVEEGLEGRRGETPGWGVGVLKTQGKGTGSHGRENSTMPNTAEKSGKRRIEKTPFDSA